MVQIQWWQSIAAFSTFILFFIIDNGREQTSDHRHQKRNKPANHLYAENFFHFECFLFWGSTFIALLSTFAYRIVCVDSKCEAAMLNVYDEYVNIFIFCTPDNGISPSNQVFCGCVYVKCMNAHGYEHRCHIDASFNIYLFSHLNGRIEIAWPWFCYVCYRMKNTSRFHIFVSRSIV